MNDVDLGGTVVRDRRFLGVGQRHNQGGGDDDYDDEDDNGNARAMDFGDEDYEDGVDDEQEAEVDPETGLPVFSVRSLYRCVRKSEDPNVHANVALLYASKRITAPLDVQFDVVRNIRPGGDARDKWFYDAFVAYSCLASVTALANISQYSIADLKAAVEQAIVTAGQDILEGKRDVPTADEQTFTTEHGIERAFGVKAWERNNDVDTHDNEKSTSSTTNTITVAMQVHETSVPTIMDLMTELSLAQLAGQTAAFLITINPGEWNGVALGVFTDGERYFLIDHHPRETGPVFETAAEEDAALTDGLPSFDSVLSSAVQASSVSEEERGACVINDSYSGIDGYIMSAYMIHNADPGRHFFAFRLPIPGQEAQSVSAAEQRQQQQQQQASEEGPVPMDFADDGDEVATVAAAAAVTVVSTVTETRKEQSALLHHPPPPPKVTASAARHRKSRTSHGESPPSLEMQSLTVGDHAVDVDVDSVPAVELAESALSTSTTTKRERQSKRHEDGSSGAAPVRHREESPEKRSRTPPRQPSPDRDVAEIPATLSVTNDVVAEASAGAAQFYEEHEIPVTATTTTTTTTPVAAPSTTSSAQPRRSSKGPASKMKSAPTRKAPAASPSPSQEK